MVDAQEVSLNETEPMWDCLQRGRKEKGVSFVKGGHDFPMGARGVCLLLRGKGIEIGSEVTFDLGSLSPPRLSLWREWEWTRGAMWGRLPP